MEEANTPSDPTPTFIGKCGGRTFLITLGCGAMTSLLTYLKVLDSTAYTTVILGTVGAYIAGNTVQKVKAP